MHATTRFLRDLVALPSVNPMGRDMAGSAITYEHRVTAYLEDYFRYLGVRYERQPVAPQRDNIVAYYEPEGATSTLILEVHQDTVPVDYMTVEPFGAHVENGRLYGRGACDVKGGMSSMLHAFTRLVQEKPEKSCRVILACTVDEESTFLGVQRFVKDDHRRRPEEPVFAVVAEPTGLDIVRAHKGVVRWYVQTGGRSCHSSRPELGLNAVYRMGEVLGHIERYAEELRKKTHALLGPATLSVGRIEGGTSVNTVPDRCRIDIDRRVLPGEDPLRVAEDLDEYLRRKLPADLAFTTSEPFLNCPALSPVGSEALVMRLGEVIDAVRGSHEVHAVPYGTDASSLAMAGIPAVVFGPGDIAQAHTCDEWIELAQMEAAAEVLFRFATGW